MRKPHLTSFFKRAYADMKIGQVTIFPLLSMANFMLIAYNFTDLQDILSFEIFGILFVVLFSITLIVLGKVMRRKQQSIEMKLVYERDLEKIKDNHAICLVLQRMFSKDTIEHRILADRIHYYTRILEKNEI